MTPTFTVLIGSKGRYTLRTSLKSIAAQGLIPGDQVIVGLDALQLCGSALDDALALVESYGPAFRAFGYMGINKDYQKILPSGEIVEIGQPYSWLGVEQINHAMRAVEITGSHTFTIGDDDIFVPGAYDTLRAHCAVDPLRPVIYRFVAPSGGLLWDKPRMRPCLISGCCIAAPTRFTNLMHTRIETTHDYDWMMDVVQNARSVDKLPLWLDYVGVIARPDTQAVRPEWTYEARIVDACEDAA